MQEIALAFPIKDVFLKSKEHDKFLLLSISSTDILWVVKIQGKEKEFWELIQMTLPYGVTIKGIAANNEKDSMINGLYLVKKKSEVSRREMISNCFWIMSFKINKESSQDVVLNDNSIEIDLENYLNLRTQRTLKNSQLVFTNEPIEYFNSNYTKIFSTIQKEIEIEKRIGMNEEEEEEASVEIKKQIDIDDMNILIQQLGIKISNQGNNEQDWKLNQKKFTNYKKENNNSIEFIYLQADDSNPQCKDSSILLDLIKSTPTQTIANDNKHFAISINAIFSKDICLQELVERYKGYTKHILETMIKFNTEQEANISSFSITINSISLPVCVVYSVPKEIKSFTTSLQNQSNYYKSIFLLNDNDNIAYSYLANHLDYSIACTKSTYLSTEYFMNIHQHLKDNDETNRKIIKGDYLTSLCYFEDRSFGTGYHAIQTVISWFFFNNNDLYPNLIIPTIQNIKQALLLLGEISLNEMDKAYDINMNQLTQVLSFFMDIQCETNTLYSNQLELFKQELERIYGDNQHEQSPVILSLGKNGFFTVMGYDKQANEMLVISHEYIGKISLINLLKMNIIKWVNIESVLSSTKRFEYLTLHKLCSLFILTD